MPQRLASLVALLAFVVCLVVGTVQAGNPFATTVGRALAAMAGTYVVGLVVGVMGRRAIDDSLAPPKAAVVEAAVPATPQPKPTVKPTAKPAAKQTVKPTAGRPAKAGR